MRRSRHENGAGSEEWTLPKGHVQDGETPEMAARREAEEETGWRVALRRPAGQITYAIPKDADAPEGGKGTTRKRVLFWHMRAIVSYGEPAKTSDGEVKDIGWFAPRTALRHLTYREQADLLADHLSPLESPVRPSFSLGSTRWRLERLTQSLAIYAVQLEARVGPEHTPDGASRSPELQRLWVEASALLETSRDALGRGDLNGAWESLFAAQEREVLVWGEAEVKRRSIELLEEADKKLPDSWRGKSIHQLLDWTKAPKNDEEANALTEDDKRERLSRAMRLRNESFSNRYRGFDNTKRQLVVLGVIAAVLAAVLAVLLVTEVVPLTNTDTPTSDQIFGVVLFGALGGAFSGALSLLKATPRGVPDSLVEGWTTSMRPVVGAVGALAAFAFLAAGVLGINGGEAAYAVAFAAGFSERLVSKAAEALSG